MEFVLTRTRFLRAEAGKSAYVKLQAQFKELSQEAVKLRNRVPRETMRSDRAEDWLEKERAKMEKRVAQVQVCRRVQPHASRAPAPTTVVAALQADMKRAHAETAATHAELASMRSAYVAAQDQALKTVADNKQLLVCVGASIGLYRTALLVSPSPPRHPTCVPSGACRAATERGHGVASHGAWPA